MQQNIIKIENLTTKQKLQIMEDLWIDLSKNNEIDSPEWHATALSNTEKNLLNGKEEPVDWDDAKNELRKRF